MIKDKEKLEQISLIVTKYHDLLFSTPGIQLVSNTDVEITAEVLHSHVIDARKHLPSVLDGIPVKVKGRSKFTGW